MKLTVINASLILLDYVDKMYLMVDSDALSDVYML